MNSYLDMLFCLPATWAAIPVIDAQQTDLLDLAYWLGGQPTLALA